ncbi:uncharacterized protein LOC131034397 [Cryptomeria japonica]|uniref:uncharacterized protein LOC131034397 n=1 Tax=Cryptomeria japonica TaxID=3369 RepID=UPI0025ABAB05|nr:uncharacterized protein LOC131034397 [Cryptomeria japonica]
MAKFLECILCLFKPDSGGGEDVEVKASPTLDELKTHFQKATIDDLIDGIKELLEINKGLKTKHDNPSTSSESASTKEKPLFKLIGGKILKIFNKRMEKMAGKVDLFQSDGEVPQVVSEILEQVGKAHWTVAGLSMIGYLLSKKGKMLKNQGECLELLQHMFELASHIKNVKHLLQQEAEMPRKALDLIAKGSMICASQLKSKKFFRLK